MRARVFVLGCLLSVAIAMGLCGFMAAISPYSLTSSVADLFGFPAMEPQGYLPSTAMSPEALIGFPSSLLPDSAGEVAFMGLTPTTSSMLSGFPAVSGISSFTSPVSQVPTGSSFTYPGFLMPSLAYQQSLAGLNPLSVPTSTNNYTEDSNGKTITINKGDIIHVQLPARLDQDYLWNLSVTHGLNVTSTRMYPPEQVIPISSSGEIVIKSIQEWEVQAIEPGTQYITAVYERSGTDGPAEKTYTLTVIVV